MSDTPETDAAQHEGLLRTNPIPLQVVTAEFARRLERERDEARESLRILAGLVAYGLGQSGEEWSLEAMRQATTAIKNAKSLEETK
jgi:hypothetical protein